MIKTKQKRTDINKPGPKAETLVIKGVGWKAAINKALKKKRPPEGWPKPSKD